MASTPHLPAGEPTFDRTADEASQGEPRLWDFGVGPKRGRLRVRTLITLRWFAIAGQTLTVLIVGVGLGLPVPFALCFTLIVLAAWVNLLVSLTSSGQRIAEDWEATAQISFDVIQLAGLLYLTGGVVNPFSLLLIAPVVLAAA